MREEALSLEVEPMTGWARNSSPGIVTARRGLRLDALVSDVKLKYQYTGRGRYAKPYSRGGAIRYCICTNRLVFSAIHKTR